MPKIIEGYMPFLGFKTYYRIVGENKNNGKLPLLCLHGGPGSTHNYFEVFDELAKTDDRQIIMYDQLGCGNSYLEGHPELWNQNTWLDELEALREHLQLTNCHIVGQSWGGMMQIAYAIDRKPKGIASYIISSGHPSSALWKREGMRRIKMMPEHMQEAIYKAIETDTYTDEAYLLAVNEYMRRYCNPRITSDTPACITNPRRQGKEAYLYGWGPNEFCPTGSLKDFEYVDRLGEIEIPSLICSGIQDLCSPLIAKTMHDGIANSQWILYEHSHHVCYIDDNEKYMRDIAAWMNKHDNTNK